MNAPYQSFAAVMRDIFYTYEIPHPQLVQLRQKCIAVALANTAKGVESVDVALDVRDLLDEGQSVAVILAMDFKYEDNPV